MFTERVLSINGQLLPVNITKSILIVYFVFTQNISTQYWIIIEGVRSKCGI